MTPKHLAFAILLFAFFACSGDNTLTYGGQTYKTVKICEQVWFAENLNYEVEGSVCYDNNPDNCAKYGRLYNWETAMKVCPKGWHLPSNAEWDKLLRFVDGDKGSESPYESPTAGKHLKATRGWNSSKGASGNGTDDYDFSALPSGYRSSDGSFRGIGSVGIWWSASEDEDDASEDEDDASYAYGRIMYRDDNINYGIPNKSNPFSVRCIQD